MIFFKRLFNKLKNTYNYRGHTKEVNRFVIEMYPTLTAKSILGPLFDNDNFYDREDQKDLFYLVTFNKDCPENQVHLKVEKSSKKVSEVQRL